MRQLFHFITTAFVSLILFACSKSSVTDIAEGTSSNSTQLVPLQKKIIGEWITPASYFLNVDRIGNLSIMGEKYFAASTQPEYDKVSHVELVYARIPDRLSFEYKKLDHNMSNRVILKYSLGLDAFRLYFTNTAYSQLLNSLTQVVSEGWEFRYIVIPRSTFENTQIEWANYLLVASALQFTP